MLSDMAVYFYTQTSFLSSIWTTFFGLSRNVLCRIACSRPIVAGGSGEIGTSMGRLCLGLSLTVFFTRYALDTSLWLPSLLMIAAYCQPHKQLRGVA